MSYQCSVSVMSLLYSKTVKCLSEIICEGTLNLLVVLSDTLNFIILLVWQSWNGSIIYSCATNSYLVIIATVYICWCLCLSFRVIVAFSPCSCPSPSVLPVLSEVTTLFSLSALFMQSLHIHVLISTLQHVLFNVTTFSFSFLSGTAVTQWLPAGTWTSSKRLFPAPHLAPWLNINVLPSCNVIVCLLRQLKSCLLCQGVAVSLCV